MLLHKHTKKLWKLFDKIKTASAKLIIARTCQNIKKVVN